MPRTLANGSRPVGRVVEYYSRKTAQLVGYKYRHQYFVSSGKHRSHTRTFRLSAYESQEECRRAAVDYQNSYCKEYGFLVNPYWELEEGVISMQLNFKDGPLLSNIFTKFDSKYLDSVLQYKWLTSTEPVTRMFIAYSTKLRRTLGSYIMSLSDTSRKRTRCFYINGNTLDCRSQNLSAYPTQALRPPRTMENAEDSVRTRSDGRLEFRYTENGKRRSVYFTEKKYGSKEDMRRAAYNFVNEYKNRKLTADMEH